MTKLLLAAEIAFGRLDRSVAEKKLNLLQLATCQVKEASAERVPARALPLAETQQHRWRDHRQVRQISDPRHAGARGPIIFPPRPVHGPLCSVVPLV